MKRLLVMLLLFPLPLFGQFLTDSAKGKFLILPGMATDNPFSREDILVTCEIKYRSLFPEKLHDSLPFIDFNRQELIGLKNCPQCLAICPERPGCHRNACQYVTIWYLRERKPELSASPWPVPTGPCEEYTPERRPQLVSSDSSYSRLWGKCSEAGKSRPDFRKNTLAICQADADCNATFSHEFFIDSAKKTVTWRLYESYGGCRAFRKHPFVYLLPAIPAGFLLQCEIYRNEEKDECRH